MRLKGKITKLEIIERLSDRLNIPKSKAEKAIEVFKEIMQEALREDKKILIRNFFKAEPYISKSRTIKIPGTKKIIKTKEKKKLRITLADALLKNGMNKKEI